MSKTDRYSQYLSQLRNDHDEVARQNQQSADDEAHRLGQRCGYVFCEHCDTRSEAQKDKDRERAD